MKTATLFILSVFLIVGLVATVGAQSEAPKAPDVKIEAKPPDVKIEGKIESKNDAPAASPRTEGSGGKILGLNPTVAMVAGAALLVVVILALVAMTRNNPSRA